MPKRAVSTRPKGWQVPPLEEAGPEDKVITHSEIEAFRQCQLKWKLGYEERWKIADEDREDDHPLTKGTLYHAVMEEHYTIIKRFQDEGGSPEVMMDQIAAAVALLLWDQETGKQSELQALVYWMYQGYVEKYGFDPQWEILGVEVKFQARLYDPQGNPTNFLLKGKLDLVVRDRKTGKVWIVDHKSGKDLPNELELDVADQFTLYAWLLLRAGIEVIGVVHSGNRTTQNLGDKPENQDAEGNPLKSTQKKQTLDQRLRRTLLTRGKRELEAVAKDAWAVAANMYPEFAGLEALPIYTAPDPRQCSWKCDFLDVHLMARKGRNLHSALKEFGFTQQFEERY